MGTQRKKILLVDDSVDDRFYYKCLLKNENFIFIEAESLAEAFDRYVQEAPDCILLDHCLPDGYGHELVDKVHSSKDWVPCPIILLTGHGDEKIAVKAMKKGVKDYFDKNSITRNKLCTAVHSCLERAQKELKNLQDEKYIMYIASHDTLTGLLNRREFRNTVEREIAISNRHHQQFAIYFIDLDKFKQINDSLGHAQGDVALKEVAMRLKQSVRKEDVVARLGGDEFAILFSRISKEQHLVRMAKDLIDVLNKPYELLGKQIQMEASIGIATFPYCATAFESLMHQADVAMYHAKQENKSHYKFFSNELVHSHEMNLKLEQLLHEAIDNHYFQMFYQPQIDIHKKNLVGVEAILRLYHPEVGEISSTQFRPIVEEAGLSAKLGKLVIAQALNQFETWTRHLKRDIKFSFPVSPQQLLDSLWVDDLCQLISSSNLNPRCLEICIQESILNAYGGKLIDPIDVLNEYGVTLCIDKFGAQELPLGKLITLPVTSLKLDRDLIWNLSNEQSTQLFKTIIEVSHILDINLITTGVDMPEQLALLEKSQCNIAQGNYWVGSTDLKKLNTYI